MNLYSEKRTVHYTSRKKKKKLKKNLLIWFMLPNLYLLRTEQCGAKKQQQNERTIKDWRDTVNKIKIKRYNWKQNACSWHVVQNFALNYVYSSPYISAFLLISTHTLWIFTITFYLYLNQNKNTHQSYSDFYRILNFL